MAQRGGLAGDAEPALLGRGIDLDHDAVNFKTECVAEGFGGLAELPHVCDGVDGGDAGVGAETDACKRCQSGLLGFEEHFACGV